MLEYVNLTWYDRVTFQGNSSLDGTNIYSVILFLKDFSDVYPFYMGTKPKPSKHNYLGDTDVDHIQLHGTIWDDRYLNRVPNPNPVAGYTSKFKWKFKLKSTSGYSEPEYTLPIFEGCSIHESPTYLSSSGMPSWQADWGDTTIGFLNLTGWGVHSWGNKYYPEVNIRCNIYTHLTDKFYRLFVSQPIVLPSYTFSNEMTFEGGVFTLSKGLPTTVTVRLLHEVVSIEEASRCCREYIELIKEPLLKLVRSKDYSHKEVFRPPLSLAIDTDFSVSIQYLFSLRKVLLFDAKSKYSPDYSKLAIEFGDATQSAADACLRWTGNAIPYVKELFELKSTIADLVQLLQGDVTWDNLSSLWLSGRYGLKLTYRDTVDLIKSIIDYVKNPPSKWWTDCRGRTGSNPEVRAKLYVDPMTRNGFAAVVKGLMDWDVFPTLTNAWDLIPYSFVADWFVDIEGYLQAIDTQTYLSVLNVFSCLYTCKTWVTPESAVWHGYTGNVGITFFKRFSTDVPFEPVPSFSGSLPSKKNIIDGAALIIQRLPK